MDKALVLIPEVRLIPEMTSEAGNVFSRKVNISVLNGTAVTFTVNSLHLVRNSFILCFHWIAKVETYMKLNQMKINLSFINLFFF
jgi:hypothetical protein